MVYELKQCPEKVNQVSEDYLSDSSFQARRKIYAIGFLLASVLNQKVWMSQTRKDQCPVSWSWAWGEGTSQSEQRHTWWQHITRGRADTARRLCFMNQHNWSYSTVCKEGLLHSFFTLHSGNQCVKCHLAWRRTLSAGDKNWGHKQAKLP